MPDAGGESFSIKPTSNDFIRAPTAGRASKSPFAVQNMPFFQEWRVSVMTWNDVVFETPQDAINKVLLCPHISQTSRDLAFCV